MNNHQKMISLYGAPKVWENFFRESLSWWTNLFEQKIYGEFILNGRTNDQIMPR